MVNERDKDGLNSNRRQNVPFPSRGTVQIGDAKIKKV